MICRPIGGSLASNREAGSDTMIPINRPKAKRINDVSEIEYRIGEVIEFVEFAFISSSGELRKFLVVDTPQRPRGSCGVVDSSFLLYFLLGGDLEEDSCLPRGGAAVSGVSGGISETKQSVRNLPGV